MAEKVWSYFSVMHLIITRKHSRGVVMAGNRGRSRLVLVLLDSSGQNRGLSPDCSVILDVSWRAYLMGRAGEESN